VRVVGNLRDWISGLSLEIVTAKMKGSFALVAVAACLGTVQAQAASGPTVDLGYTVHRATINVSSQLAKANSICSQFFN
jgi:hypothetical protein